MTFYNKFYTSTLWSLPRFVFIEGSGYVEDPGKIIDLPSRSCGNQHLNLKQVFVCCSTEGREDSFLECYPGGDHRSRQANATSLLDLYNLRSNRFGKRAFLLYLKWEDHLCVSKRKIHG